MCHHHMPILMILHHFAYHLVLGPSGAPGEFSVAGNLQIKPMDSVNGHGPATYQHT